MGILEEIEELYNCASSAMTTGDFGGAIETYKSIISKADEIKNMDSPPIDAPTLNRNLAICYYDLSWCNLKICGNKINESVHALIEAINLGFREQDAFQNLLYCMEIANKFMAARMQTLPNTGANKDFVRMHNIGFDLLKTPDPLGTPNRNWQGAVNGFLSALEINPESAASFHGLGLAYEGLRNNDENAIKAWFQVKNLDPEYNFEYRIKYILK